MEFCVLSNSIQRVWHSSVAAEVLSLNRFIQALFHSQNVKNIYPNISKVLTALDITSGVHNVNEP